MYAARTRKSGDRDGLTFRHPYPHPLCSVVACTLQMCTLLIEVIIMLLFLIAAFYGFLMFPFFPPVSLYCGPCNPFAFLIVVVCYNYYLILFACT